MCIRDSDGLEADLIITDVLLAGVDGYTLLQRVRTDARLCTVPVVVLSSKGLTSDRIAGFNAGASAYVSKPFDVQELLAVVRQLLAASLATHRTEELEREEQRKKEVHEKMQADRRAEGAAEEKRKQDEADELAEALPRV